MGSSKKDIEALCKKLLREQTRRSNRERRLPYAQKLRILDRLMAEGPPTVEEE